MTYQRLAMYIKRVSFYDFRKFVKSWISWGINVSKFKDHLPKSRKFLSEKHINLLLQTSIISLSFNKKKIEAVCGNALTNSPPPFLSLTPTLFLTSPSFYYLCSFTLPIFIYPYHLSLSLSVWPERYLPHLNVGQHSPGLTFFISWGGVQVWGWMVHVSGLHITSYLSQQPSAVFTMRATSPGIMGGLTNAWQWTESQAINRNISL